MTNRGVKKKDLTPLFFYSKIIKVLIRASRVQGKRAAMEKIVEQGMLYDFYGELLTKHQRELYEDVIFNNLSLGEIAEEQGISRQGVHDLIKRCDKALADYEGKLHLMEKFQRIKEMVSDITLHLDQIDSKENQIMIDQIKIVTGKIVEEL